MQLCKGHLAGRLDASDEAESDCDPRDEEAEDEVPLQAARFVETPKVHSEDVVAETFTIIM